MSNDDRAHAALRALILDAFPRFVYLGVHEYAVQATNGVTVDALPTDTTIPLPGLVAAPLRGFASVKPKIGSRVLVSFINADPTRPIIVGVDPVPEEVGIDAVTVIRLAGGGPKAAREGDSVDVGTLVIAGSGVTCTYTPPGGAPVVGNTINLVGEIDEGSSKVEIGG